MDNAQMIQQVRLHIENLTQEKTRIEQEITAAQNYLNVLQGNISNIQSGETRKGNQTDEARERMKKAQQARQERERKLRINTIKDFLSKRKTATTQEIANLLNLKENATKRYLRSCSNFEEVQINVWQYDRLPF